MFLNKKLIPNATKTALFTALSALTVSAMAVDGVPREIDPDAPIAAIERLDSLKQVEPLEFNLPDIERFTTANDVPVSFVRTTEVPIVDIKLLFNAGSARDSEVRLGGFGISNMAATMLKGGTANLSEDEFNQQVEQLGLWLNANAYKDMFEVNLRSLSDDDHLKPAVNILQDMLANPTYDADVLNRNKAQLVSELQQNQQYPGFIAEKTYTNALFGDHPYGHMSSGTPETVSTITQADLREFDNKFLVADNVKLTMTGDLTSQQARVIANTITSALPRGEKASPLSTPTPLTTSRRIDVPFDTPQTMVRMGQIGNKRSSDPTVIQDQTNFTIGNEVIGAGGFGSRLMKEIRKKRGYTYGIYSNMGTMQTNGPYTIKFSARPDVVEDAINTTLDIVEDTLDNGITEKEFRLTKEKFVNSYPTDFSSNKNINSMVATTTFYDLPDDYLENYFTRLDQATLSDVNMALNETLEPEKFLIVTVGQQD